MTKTNTHIKKLNRKRRDRYKSYLNGDGFQTFVKHDFNSKTVKHIKQLRQSQNGIMKSRNIIREYI